MQLIFPDVAFHFPLVNLRYYSRTAKKADPSPSSRFLEVRWHLLTNGQLDFHLILLEKPGYCIRWEMTCRFPIIRNRTPCPTNSKQVTFRIERDNSIVSVFLWRVVKIFDDLATLRIFTRDDFVTSCQSACFACSTSSDSSDGFRKCSSSPWSTGLGTCLSHVSSVG